MICQNCGKPFERKWAQLNCSIKCGTTSRFANPNKRHKARREALRETVIREYVLELRHANRMEDR